MPVVKRIGPYEFRFYTRGEENEPPHIHVLRGRLEAKFWLTKEPSIARSGRYAAHELNRIADLIEENREEFLDAWYTYFG